MFIVRAGYIEIPSADIIHSLVINQERAVRVLDSAMRGEDSVIRLDDCRGDSRGGVNGKFELRLLTIVGGETFEQEGAKARASTAAKRMEDQEALKRGAVIC